MAKSIFDMLTRDLTRGFGLQTGRSASKEVGRYVKERTLDNNSKHRKLVNRFTMPGTFKGGLSKIYTLIDSFENEYLNTKAMLQHGMYLESDINFIEDRIKFLERLMLTENEERAYERLGLNWMDIKSQF
jgi:hypothetical protein